MNDSRHLNIILQPQKTINPLITLLVLSTNALEHHAMLKNVIARERHVYKNEAYILGALKGREHDFQLVFREPGNRAADLMAGTLQAIRLFRPQSAFLLGLAVGARKSTPGNVIISSASLKSKADILALVPQAKGFFQALQSNPEVPGTAILSIHKSAEEGTGQALENLVTATLNAWQQIDCN